MRAGFGRGCDPCPCPMGSQGRYNPLDGLSCQEILYAPSPDGWVRDGWVRDGFVMLTQREHRESNLHWVSSSAVAVDLQASSSMRPKREGKSCGASSRMLLHVRLEKSPSFFELKLIKIK
jgi:hypothetical protein